MSKWKWLLRILHSIPEDETAHALNIVFSLKNGRELEHFEEPFPNILGRALGQDVIKNTEENLFCEQLLTNEERREAFTGIMIALLKVLH